MKRKYSKQREEILSLLRSVDTHPTAEWLYSALKPRLPELSMATVYRNLNVLEQSGDIVRLTFGSSLDHFDAALHPHSHFCCRQCGQVYDLDFQMPRNTLQTAQKTTQHRVETCRVEFYGLCKTCGEKEKPHS